MLTWTYIDLDPEEVNNVKNIYLANLMFEQQYFFRTLNLGITKFIGRDVDHTHLIFLPGRSSGYDNFSGIHIDRGRLENVLSINIPLINCDHAVTEFWKPNSDAVCTRKITKNDIPYDSLERVDCIKIDEYVLKHPVLFRTNTPHSVTNYSQKPRLAISIRLRQDPWDLVGASWKAPSMIG